MRTSTQPVSGMKTDGLLPAFFPVLDSEHTARERIDGILDNWFTFNGETHQLANPIPWTHNPSCDLEWLILLHKFYYAPGLGLAYTQTEDIRFLHKWIELTDSWMASVPLDFLPSDVAGRRIQNWVSAYYYFVSTGASPREVEAAFLDRFRGSLKRQVSHLCGHLTPARNHRTLELTAIFFAALALPEIDDGREWLTLAREELIRNIRTDLLPDGVHCELSTDYHHLVLRNFLNVLKLADLNGIPFPADVRRKVRDALVFSMHIHKPDGIVPALSDGDARSFRSLLHEGSLMFESEDMEYVATAGQHGVPPTDRSRVFVESGYAVLRSGWGQTERFQDERYLVMDCGPLGEGNHGHLDALNIEAAAYGRSLIVDPGRYSYNEQGEPNWRALFRSTAYHNTVVVDGRNQTRYEPAGSRYKVRGPAPFCTIQRFVCAPLFDFLHAQASSYEYPVVHERMVFFAVPDYWIVADILRAEQPHNYDVLFHLRPEAQGHLELSRGAGGLKASAPGCEIIQPHSSDTCLQVREGFVSATYGAKESAPVLCFNRSAATTCFITVIFPWNVARPNLTVTTPSEPDVTLDRDGSSRVDVRVNVGGTTWQDHITVGHSGRFRFARHDVQGRLNRHHVL